MRNKLLISPGQMETLKYLYDADREAGDLFGHPLPRLPEGDELQPGQKKIFIDFPPNLGVLLRDFLHAVYPVVTAQARREKRYEESLQPLREAVTEICVQTVYQERRNGLYNLFFLALSKMLAEIVSEFFSSGSKKPYHKYLLHTEFSPFLSQVHEEAMRRIEHTSPGTPGFRLGPSFNDSLVRSIIGDQLPLVTTENEEILLQDLLGIANPRFSISFAQYKEIYAVVSLRLRHAVERRESAYLQRLQRILGHSKLPDSKDVSGMLRRTDLLNYVFMDLDEVGKKIMASKHIHPEAVSYPELVHAYIDLMQAMKRNEIIQLLKRRVEILSDRQAAMAEDLYSAGSLYRYSPPQRIVNEARNVTTLFLDLRGFTRKSEEAISAGELTDELYAIFDPMTSLVKELHGKIDKFTGDGMMVTFGVESRSKEDPLNALRMAVRVHEILRSLRRAGTTQFQVGIAIHSGVAFVSHFFAGDERVENTVIGRNVNIAGRLSSAGDLHRFQEETREFDDLVGSLSRSLSSEQEKDRFLGSLRSRKSSERTISGVSVDPKGNLYNLGIVLSHQTLQAIQQVVSLQSAEEGDVGYVFFQDPVLSRQVSIYYVGDAKFKGVESSFPVYAVLL